jgi:hypothetical protein
MMIVHPSNDKNSDLFITSVNGVFPIVVQRHISQLPAGSLAVKEAQYFFARQI